MVDIGYVKATGNSVKIRLPKTALKPEMEFEWKIPKWSNAIERDRARTYFQAYAAAVGLYFVEQAHEGSSMPAAPRPGRRSRCPTRPSAAASTKRCAACSRITWSFATSKIANYHPYPPTPWNANPRDIYGTPGPYEDAVQNTPIFEENGPDKFKGIDIMRAVRSFDPCLPCGVHMYLGGGKVLERDAHADSAARSGEEMSLGSISHEGRKLEELIGRMEALPDSDARELAQECLHSLLQLYGEGLDAFCNS